MNLTFKHYKVGGCVRDFILGKPVADIDYVVVGVTPQEMTDLGFKQVGADFPVFLHPETGDEYALARTERKSGTGYNGFTVDADITVTLVEDLARRDFTMNAMAMDTDGVITDPYNGLNDIQAGIIKHVSNAFAEDPVRVLRGARFAARYGFTIDSSTKELMQTLVDSGELDNLTKERIVAEFNKGFETTTPSIMFEVLNSVSAMPRLFPNAVSFQNPDVWNMMNENLSIDSKWAILQYTSYKNKNDLLEFAKDFRFPTESLSLAISLLKIEKTDFNNLTSEDKLKVWSDLDFRRKSAHAIEVLRLKNIIDDAGIDVDYWLKLSSDLKSVSEENIIKSCQKGEDFKLKIKEARLSMCDLSDRTTEYAPS